MIRALTVLFLLGVMSWAGTVLVLLVREAHRRGLARAHTGRSWAPREEL